MADDFNKKILIDIEVGTDGQAQINQYKAAFDSLRNSINGLSNPLAGLSGNIGSLGKDMSKLNETIDKLNSQNEKLKSSGDKVKDTVNDLAGSFGTWDGIIKIFTESFDALKLSLSGGLAIIVTFLPQIIDWVGGLFKANQAVSSLNSALKDNKAIMDAVNQVRAQGKDDAQQELIRLKMLYDASQKRNASQKEQRKIVAELQSEFPDYFGNLTTDAILQGKATKEYDKLTEAIMGNSRAKSAQETITKNMLRQFSNDKTIEQQTEKLKKLNDQLVEAQKQLSTYLQNKKGGDGVQGFDSKADELYGYKQSAEEQVKAAKNAISDLKHNSTLLKKQNDALTAMVAEDTKNNGARVLGIVAKDNNDLIDLNKSTLQQQKAFAGEADRIRADSLRRQPQSTYSAYGSEVLAENNRYQDELKKLTEFLKNKQITQKQFDASKNQLLNENHANLEAITNKYNEQDKERTQQALNELAELRIKNMRDGADKEKAEVLQQQAEKLQELDKANADILGRQRKLQAEIKTASSHDLPVLKKKLGDEETAWWLSYAKRLEITKQTTAAIKAIDDKEADDAARKKNEQLLTNDKRAVDNADDPQAKFEAQKKEINDKYQFEITAAKGNAIALSEIQKNLQQELDDVKTAYDKKKDQADKQRRRQLKDEELKDAKELADQAFSIVSNGIKQSSDAKIASMEQDKQAELNNSSLTSAQKLAIEQKFKQQEAQVKAKAFKQEQEASIAQAVINGALAITKATAQSGVLSPFVVPVIIAETAVEIAKIAAQKPPAYASGGLHYSSDGRGGVLPGYSKTDNTNAWLRSGEGVVVSEAMRIPWARNLVSAINVGFGGRDFSIANPGRGYAVGGIFTDGGDANRYYNQPVHDQKNLANSIAYQMINNFPPVYVDVKDINNQQNILAQTINRVNL